MKDVTVYRCGKVVADGFLLKDVRDVSPPIRDVLGSVTFDVTGTLTYSPDKYAAPPIEAAHPSISSDQLQRFYDAGKIDYPSYWELMRQMNITPCVPPPPKPEHKDTARVHKVRERIDKLYKEGLFSNMTHEHLFAALA